MRVGNTIIHPRTIAKGFILSNIFIWLFVIIPTIYSKGLVNSLLSLNSNSYNLVSCLFLFILISGLLYCAISQLYFYLLGPLLHSERMTLFSNSTKDNFLLQWLIIIIEEERRNSIEALIWAVILFIFTCLKANCVVISGRLQENKLQNLEKLNAVTIMLTITSVLMNIIIFNKAGLALLSIMNFEAIFILKECLVSFYQLSKNKTLNGSTELLLQIFDNVFKIIQWIQLATLKDTLFTTNPAHFFLLIKLQGYTYALFSFSQQYFNYKHSIHSFTQKYPTLSPEESEKLDDDKCCICWDLLKIGKICKITCGHALHVECIWKWMLRNTERQCPICKQIFLLPDAERAPSWFSRFNIFTRNRRRTEEDMQRLREIFPNLTENEILSEIERTGSVERAIENLVDWEA